MASSPRESKAEAAQTKGRRKAKGELGDFSLSPSSSWGLGLQPLAGEGAKRDLELSSVQIPVCLFYSPGTHRLCLPPSPPPTEGAVKNANREEFKIQAHARNTHKPSIKADPEVGGVAPDSKHIKRIQLDSFLRMGLGLQTLSMLALTFLSAIGQMHGKGQNCVCVGWASHSTLTWDAWENWFGKGHDGDSSVPHHRSISHLSPQKKGVRRKCQREK